MKEHRKFIIIDDDLIGIKLCRKIIEKTFPNSTITDFPSAEVAYKYIAGTPLDSIQENKITVLLDDNMPIMNGWDFLEKFNLLDERIKSRFAIYLMSSSVDKSEMERAQANKNIEYYLIKPITKETIRLTVHAQDRKKEYRIVPLRVLVEPGDAPNEVIADILAEISILNRMIGGEGVNFELENVHAINPSYI